MGATAYHVFTSPVADGTNTQLVRPSNWNESHALTINAVGSEISNAFGNGGGVTFGYDGTNITASAPSGGGGGGVAISAGTNSTNTGTVVFSNANGVSFGMNTDGVVTGTVATNYQSQGAYLTTARASNDAVGLNSAFTAGPLLMTINSAGLSLNAASAAGTTSGFGGNLISGSMTHNTAGLNLSLNHPAWLTTAQPVGAYITTARASNDGIGLNTAQSNVVWTVNSGGLSLDARGYAGTGTSATNASITLNSNGLAISVAAPGGGAAINVSAGTTSNNLQTIQFDNSNGISFGLNGSTVTASHNALTTAMASNRGTDFVQATAAFAGTNASGTIASNGISVSVNAGGGGITVSKWEPTPPTGTALATLGQNSIHFLPLWPTENITFTGINMVMSFSSATSSVSHSVGHTVSYGMYSQLTGASTSQIAPISTSSMFIQVSYSSNLSGGYTINMNGSSTTVSSAGTVFGSVLSGLKQIALPFASSFSGGQEYYFAIANSTASVGNTGALRASFLLNNPLSNASMGRIATSGIVASNASYKLDMAGFMGSVTSNAFTTVGDTARSIWSNVRPYVIFEA